MAKVIKQAGKDEEITLEWAVENAQKSYNAIFEVFDELVKPKQTKEKKELTEIGKKMTNNLVRSLKMATLLSDEKAVLNSIFGEFGDLASKVEVVQKTNVVNMFKEDGDDQAE